MTETLDSLLRKAADHQRDGMLDDARAIYEAVLRKYPDHPDALHLNGMVSCQQGDCSAGIKMIQRAIARDPGHSLFYNSLGNAFQAKGMDQNAEKCFQAAIRLNAGYVQARINLINLYIKSERLDAARQLAAEMDPTALEDVETCLGAGLVFLALERNECAAMAFDRALERQPEDGGVYFRIAEHYRAHDMIPDALSIYRRAIERNLDGPEIHNNLGVILRSQGHLETAIVHYRTAVSHDSQFSEAMYNLANALRDTGRIDEAIAWYQRSLAVKPDDPNVHHNLATQMSGQGRLDEAISHYERAVMLNQTVADACNQLCYLLMQTCDWEKMRYYGKILEDQNQAALSRGEVAVASPFLNVALHQDPAYNFRVARSHSRRSLHSVSLPPFTHDPLRREKRQRIRLGYMSNNFKNHPTAHLLHELFGHHDRNRFDVYVYSVGVNDGSPYRRHIENTCDVFRDLRGIDEETIASRVHQDGIDIYIDLMGQTTGSRMKVAACRPAPIQVRYLGMAGTTGAEFFDYIVTDRIVTPPDQSPFYTEAFAYLPHSYQFNSRKFVDPSKNWQRNDFGLSDVQFVFSTFNTSYKIDREQFSIWMEILATVPQSVLWMMGGGTTLEQNLSRAAQDAGISPDRIVFSGKLPKTQHLRRLSLADLVLDTRIVNGAASTSDALWMGIPVITLQGRHFASRMSASILTAVGMPELITTNADDYKRLAVSLASDPDLYHQYRSRLTANLPICPLFDTVTSVKMLERLYQQMWHRFTIGEAPDHINCLPS